MTAFVDLRKWVALLLVAMCLGVVTHSVIGQEEEKEAPARAERVRAQGRLPAYFAGVVNAKQREEVYAIQAKYASQIEELQKQLDALVDERDKAIDGVLTEEQLAEVNQKREAAREQRSQRARRPAAASTAENPTEP